MSELESGSESMKQGVCGRMRRCGGRKVREEELAEERDGKEDKGKREVYVRQSAMRVELSGKDMRVGMLDMARNGKLTRSCIRCKPGNTPDSEVENQHQFYREKWQSTVHTHSTKLSKQTLGLCPGK